MGGKSRIKPSHYIWTTWTCRWKFIICGRHFWKRKKNMLKGKGILTPLQKGILLNTLRRALGEDYLERIEKRVREFRTEVIIAVENIAQNGGENHE